MLSLRCFLAATIVALVCLASVADDPDFSAELPRIAPTSPEKAIDTFQVKNGYRIAGTISQDLDLFSMPVEVQVQTANDPVTTRVLVSGTG